MVTFGELARIGKERILFHVTIHSQFSFGGTKLN
jgi:hypothetical protein